MRDPSIVLPIDSSASWQKILAQGFSSSQELLKFLGLPSSLGSSFAEQQFKMRVPRDFAARMQPGNERDPLLLQVLAVPQEMQVNSNYFFDSLAEASVNPLPGLMHKYQGRVLLTVTGICAINCRYCFRRHFPYQDNNPGRDGWQAVVDYIKQDPLIHEVVLSGGDPLLATDRMLESLVTQLADIKHLRTLRFHTRVPIVLPQRIDRSFLCLLKSIQLRKVIVLHCNHAQEIDKQVQNVCFMLRDIKCHLLNQSVLLKNINDSVQTLVNLSEALFDCGVLPYYLHLLDKTTGTAHFDMPIQDALMLYRELQKRLPGYLLPRLAYEEPGKASKTLLC